MKRIINIKNHLGNLITFKILKEEGDLLIYTINKKVNLNIEYITKNDWLGSYEAINKISFDGSPEISINGAIILKDIKYRISEIYEYPQENKLNCYYLKTIKIVNE